MRGPWPESPAIWLTATLTVALPPLVGVTLYGLLPPPANLPKLLLMAGGLAITGLGLLGLWRRRPQAPTQISAPRPPSPAPTPSLRHFFHELKTPLASLHEGSELLADGSLGSLKPQQQAVITILQESCTELQALVEQLIAFTHWQARQYPLQHQPVSMPSLVNALAEAYATTCTVNAHQLHRHTEDITLYCDWDKLYTLLEQLLVNAMRFSPPHSDLWLHVEAIGNILVIDVADSGPGIPEAAREAIFQPFYRTPPPTPGTPTGYGLGLAKAHYCAQLLGAEIQLRHDDRYPGAQFRVQLPMQLSMGKTA